MTTTAWRSRIVGYGDANPRDLVGNPRNWRTHPDHQRAALSGVLDEVGWVAEVLVNKRSGFVVDGHLRVAAALERGEHTVPVRYVDLSEDEERLVLATIDPISALAGSDPDTLTALLEGLQPADAALASLLRDLAPPVPKELNPDDADLTPPDEPITQPGDLWLLGEHRLLCGDSTKAGDVARLMGDERATMLWTDPPYGVEYVGKTREALTIDGDSATGLASLLDGAFTSANAALEPGSPFYVAAPAGPLNLQFRLAIQRAGWKFHEGLVGVKDSMVLGHSDYHLRHEDVLYGWLPGSGRSGRGNHEGSRWYGDHSQTSVFEVDRPKRSTDHPTMKPPELVAAHMDNSSSAGEIVLELFGGSGSTLVAAEQLGRRCFALEIDPGYCDVIVRRWEHVTGGQAVKANA